MFLLSEFQELHVLGSALGEFLVLVHDLHRGVVGVHITLAGGDDGLLVVGLRAVALDSFGSLVELVGQDVGQRLVVVAAAGKFSGGVVVPAVQDEKALEGVKSIAEFLSKYEYGDEKS